MISSIMEESEAEEKSCLLVTFKVVGRDGETDLLTSGEYMQQ